MKIVHTVRLLDKGEFSKSPAWRRIEAHVTEAIGRVEWPPGSGGFTLYDEPGKGRRMGNGVRPIKEMCMLHLRSLGWSLETPVAIAEREKPGPVDATYPVGDRLFCVEWETGNVSSSHRALNKMALGILKKVLVGGALIVPTRAMYYYLTDRVGNFSELEPYFPMWRTLPVNDGLLLVVAIEHDAVSKSVPPIPKGTNGRAIE